MTPRGDELSSDGSDELIKGAAARREDLGGPRGAEVVVEPEAGSLGMGGRVSAGKGGGHSSSRAVPESSSAR
jgi:hypothetical protein